MSFFGALKGFFRYLSALLFFSLIIFALHLPANAQDADSLNIDKNTHFPDSIELKPHSAHKATLYSMMLPGLGQAYNKKYWKVPVVWAGFGTLGYFIITNNSEYRSYRDAYIYVSTGDEGDPPNDLVNRYTEDQLLAQKDYYQRNLELSYIFTALWYIINIVDAAVDAHLYDFNVDDNLSLQLMTPQMPVNTDFIPARQVLPSAGISLKLKF